MVNVSAILIAGLALIAGPPVSAAAISARDSNPTNFQYCTEPRYHGACEWTNIKKQHTCYDFVQPYNDRISSIRLSKRISCKFYKERACKGRNLLVGGGSRIPNLASKNFDNSISSFLCWIRK